MAQRYTEAKARANKKWNDKHYDRFGIALPKGKITVIKLAAEKAGESVNHWLNEAADRRLREEGFTFPQKTETDQEQEAKKEE